MNNAELSRRRFIHSAAVGTAGLALGVPAFIPRLGEAQADELHIGLVEPTTGIYATYGQSERNGIALAVDQWNAHGGVLKRKVVTLSEDDQNNPGAGVEKARKLVQQDECVALIGTINSAISLSVSGAANSLGVIFMDSGGHADDVTGKSCHFNTFRVCHSTWMETHATGFDLAKRFGKKWYLITPDYAFGHALDAGYRDVAQKIGVEIIGDDLVPLTTSDFSPYLTKVESAKPDLLISLVQGDQSVNCLKQANSFGLSKSVPLGGPQAELEVFLSLPKEARVGYWGLEWYYNSPLCIGNSKDNLAHRFIADYRKRYGVPPSARSAFGYIATDRLLWAISEAKTADAAKVARVLENTKFQSIFEGTTYFRKVDHQLIWPMWIGELRESGTADDANDIFNIVGREEGDAIEQSVDEKAKVCSMDYP